MEHYVTLFDSLFLPQGLVLARSLAEHAGPHQLWVLCIDGETHAALSRLALPTVRLLRLADVETPELLAVKDGRTRAEYCWTLTPFAPRFVFEREAGARRVTYVDADLWLRKDPKPIFDELDRSGKDVLITEHGYARPFARALTKSGKYCVQFLTFTRTGEVVRNWWEARCLEWCFARYENGKFGDQKYLDDWPDRFGDQVHVLPRADWALAPWNAPRFGVENAIFYHFHGLRLRSDTAVCIGEYPVSSEVMRRVYTPYIEALRAATRDARHLLARSFRQRSRIGVLKAAAYRAAFRVRSTWFRFLDAVTGGA